MSSISRFQVLHQGLLDLFEEEDELWFKERELKKQKAILKTRLLKKIKELENETKSGYIFLADCKFCEEKE